MKSTTNYPKRMKRFTLFALMALSLVMLIPLRALGATPYVVSSGNTLTFYYDDLKESRSGTTFDIAASYSGSSWNTSPHWRSSSITTVIFDSSFYGYTPTSTCSWFLNCSKLTQLIGLENLNTQKVTNMSWMFKNCKALKTLDLSSWQTDSLITTAQMF